MAGSVAVFAKKSSVQSPLEVHRVLGEDEVLVLCVVGDPLPVDFNLGAGDSEDEALVPFFGEVDGFLCADAGGDVCCHAVFLEDPGRID